MSQKDRLSALVADLQGFATKTANAREALEAMNIPGSEKNKPCDIPDPAGLGLAGKKQDMVPEGAAPAGTDAVPGSTDKATPGEKPVEAGNAADVTPKEVPLTKDDLDKTASLANELTQKILQHNQAAQKVAAAKPAVAAKPAAQAKVASPDSVMELTSDVLAKIAAVILATEDGAAYAQQKVAEYIGQKDTDEWMGFLRQQNAEQQKQAADAADYQAGAAYAEQLLQLAAHPLFKQGQAIGADSLGSADVGADAVPEAPPPEAGMEAGPMGEGDAEITPEDIVGALEMMVQEGEIEPEAAAELLQELMGAAEGGAEGGEAGIAPAELPAAAPDAAPAAEAIPADPPAGPAGEEPSKEASAQLKSQLMQHFTAIARK